ncbi:TPA: phage tail tape measure protein [Bacillus cereus]|nr:phage tail tape measure protein [Bacillus cereus]
MSRNKIGIEVQVEFPTASELQAKLAERWRGVKNSFEAKINIDIDGNSLRSAKAKIKNALGEEAFKVKLDVDYKNAMLGIEKLQDKISKLDAELKKVREVKVGFNLDDMNKTMKDLIDGAKKTENAMEGNKKAVEDTNKALNNTVEKYSKLETISKQLKDGSISVTTKRTGQDEKGDTVVRTERPDGRIDSTVTDNRLKALKEIEDVTKRIHQVEMQMIGADRGKFQLLNGELQIQKQQKDLMAQMYQEKYKISALDDSGLKELQRVQETNKAMKEQAVSAQKLNAEQKELEQIVSRVAQLENKKQQIQTKMLGVAEEEKQALQEQYNHYNRIQSTLKENHSLAERMTSAQKEELENIGRVAQLERNRIEAKQRAKEAQEAETNALRDMQDNLRKVHALELQILQIKEKIANGGNVSNAERAKLEILEAQHHTMQQIQRDTELVYTNEGRITDAMREQLRTQEQVQQAERERVQEATRIQSEHDQINAKLQEQEAIQRRIAQLQRDLIFAGQREAGEIQNAIQAEERKLNALRQELETAGALTQERRQEIAQIERAQQEQQRLNRLRQEAREKDQAVGSQAGGLVDPYSAFMAGEQATREILEQMMLIDESYMRVAKVADASTESLKAFKAESYDTASELGVSADQYMKAVETWVTAGETFANAQELAKTSLVGSFVGNIDADLMAKWMSVPLKAFQTDGLKANDIINVMNETANNNAVEMEELGKAYMRSATTVKTAGVSFEDLTGLITGAQEATRQGGERIGTALKTVSLNYNLIQSRMTKDQNKKYDFFDSIGINLSDTESLTDALGKLKAKWGELSEEDQATSLFYLAGKEHSNIVTGILDQWDTVKKTIGEANAEMGKGEDGSAYEEFGKQKESVRFQVAELKNAWMELMNTIGESDGLMSKILGGLTSGLQKASELMSNEKFMDTAKLIAMGVAFHALTNGALRFGDALGTSMARSWQNLKDVGNALKGLRRDTDDLTEAQRRQGQAQATANMAGGVGGHVDVDVDRNRPHGSNSGSNDSDRNRNPNDVGGRTRSNRGSQIAETAGDLASTMDAGAQATDRADGRLKGLAKTFGKVISLVPLLGDALILLDIMGYPVFEKMGGWFDGLITTQKEANEEQAKLNKEFEKSNGVMNGDINKGQEKIGGLRKQFESTDTDKNAEGVQGYMSPEEFKKFADEVNAQVDKFKLGANLKIDMNDTTHIQTQLKAIDDAMIALENKKAIDITKKVAGDVEGIQKAQHNIAGLKNEQELLATSASKCETEINKLKDANGNIKPENMRAYQFWAGELERVKGRSKDVEASLKANEQALNQNQTAIQKKGSALLKLGDQLDVTNIKEKDQKATLTAMYSEHQRLNVQLANTSNAQRLLTDNSELTNEQFQEILKNVPAAKQAYGNYSVEHVNSSGKVRKGLNDLVKAENEKAQASVDSGNKAIGKMEEQMGKTKAGGKAMQDAKKDAQDLGKGIDSIKSKDVDVVVEVTGIQWIDKLIGFFSKSWSKTVNVDVAGQQKSVSSGGNKSASVSRRVSKSVSKSANIADENEVVNKSESTSPPAKVNENVWRYWKTDDEMTKLDNSIKDIDRTLKSLKDDYGQMIDLYRQQIQLLKQEQNTLKTQRGQKESHIDETLNKLRGYGFNVNTGNNTISNLDNARNLSGDRAKEAEELLNTWRSLNGEIQNIDTKIKDIGSQVSDLTDKIEQAQIANEMKAFEGLLKRIDALLTLANNRGNIYAKTIGFISDKDKELALNANEQALNDAKNSMSYMINAFNELSKSNIAFDKNGQSLKSTLDKLGKEITATADDIIKYQRAINDIEFSRVVGDMENFNKAVDTTQSRLDNNIKNMKEGLLSGTSVFDLESSNMVDMDSRDNQLEQFAKDRIRLEEEVQEALDAFAKKNVDRQAGVANSQLTIEANKYRQMMQMSHNYASGISSNFEQIVAQFDKVASDVGIGVKDDKLLKTLSDLYSNLQKKQTELSENYYTAMSEAVFPDEIERITNRYISDNLKLQEEFYKASIIANGETIKELKKQLDNSNLTDDQEDKIKQQIANIEKDTIDAQNKIKATIKDRFEFEFNLLEKTVKQYDELNKSLDYSMKVIKALGGDQFESKGQIMDGMLSVEKARNSEIQDTLSGLKQQLSLYKEGSFEWNLLNKEVEEYKKLLDDSNLQLIEMNKNIMSNSFDSTLDKLEREMFDGKTIKQFKDYHDLWITGLEREIALEQMYQKIADLKTQEFDEKMALLDKQEKLSRFEMEYLDKQLDIISLQQKLENLNKERNVQVLKKQADGTWDWSYETDSEKIKETEREIAEAELKLQQAEQKAREEYANKLEGILDGAEKGQYKNIEEFKEAIADLTSAYDSMLGDFPKIKEEYLKELIEAYSHYIKENGDVLENIVAPDGSLNGKVSSINKELAKAFEGIGDSMAKAFADTLIDKIPSFGQTQRSDTSKSISIHLGKLEFPNVKSADGLEEAILSLPQIALQKSKGK